MGNNEIFGGAGEDLTLKEAEELIDKFPEMVGETFRFSAAHSRQTIKWWLKTIYSKGYIIVKAIGLFIEKKPGKEGG